MIYRPLGQTGLDVSILGFGASPLGAAFGPIDPEEGRRAVHAAIDLGVNYFDVAPYYGLTLAETRLGDYLKGKRQDIILATKVGRYDVNSFDFSAERVTRSVDESLKRLQTDWIDVIQVHDIEYGDRSQIIHETIPALQRLKESGKVRFVGITGYPLHQFVDILQQQSVDTVLSYCRYNLFDTSMAEVLTPVVKEKGAGLINAAPLHMGLLTHAGPPPWHPAPMRVQEMGRQVAAFCEQQGVNISSLALQFALDYPDVATTIVGMRSVAEVQMNVGAVGNPPSPEILAAVQEMIAPVANVVWQEGRPENDDPGAVPKRS